MAEGWARKIFGSSHTIASAGAKTDSGGSAAKHAVAALKRVGIDISGHATSDTEDIDIQSFDTIVVFRPSAAEGLNLPAHAAITYFDIADPYGEEFPVYCATAARIRRAVRKLHAQDVLRRIQSDPAKHTGSHAAGMFSRAAKEFEKELKSLGDQLLSRKLPVKITLGRIGTELGENEQGAATRELANDIMSINEAWVAGKHGDDPPTPQIISALERIIEAYDKLPSEATV